MRLVSRSAALAAFALLLTACDNAPPADDDLSANDPFAEEEGAEVDNVTAPDGEDDEAGVETISAAQLQPMVEDSSAILVDVRTPEEFAAGHMPGAINMPLDDFDPAAVPMEDGRETILYCRSGKRSETAATLLAAHTGASVRHLEGGIVAWEQATPMIER